MGNDEMCPICGSNMIGSGTLIGNRPITANFMCKNKCYMKANINTSNGIVQAYYIFNVFLARSNDEDCSQLLREKINYWKENDRYLMRILTT